MKKTLISLLLTIAFSSLLFCAVACNSASETPTEAPTDAQTDAPTDAPTEKATKPTYAPEQTYNITNDSENFKIIGRSIDTEGGVSCDFTASGIEVSGVMGGRVTLSLTSRAETHLTVFIDGVRQEKRIAVGSFTTKVPIANFETEGEHHIRVLKQMNSTAPCTFKSVTVNGHLNEAPADKEYLIEFLGDSITCGYGNLGNTTTGSVAGSAEYTDGTQAYSFLTAELLGADASILGCSGVGIDQGWTSFPVRDFMDKASYYRDQTLVYTDNSRAPDVVVINLGTNDQSRGSTEETFKAGVREIIEYFRTFYGKDMPIVWVHGMMNNGCIDWARAVIDELGGESAGIYTVELIHNNTGGNGHPNLASHKTAAQQLADFITEKELLSK